MENMTEDQVNQILSLANQVKNPSKSRTFVPQPIGQNDFIQPVFTNQRNINPQNVNMQPSQINAQMNSNPVLMEDRVNNRSLITTDSSPVWQLAAQYIISGTGKKDSNRFVVTLNTAMSHATPQDLAELFFGCKKYSMKNVLEFEKVANSSLEKSRTALVGLGLSEEVIESSKPRVTYAGRALALKEILNRLFWSRGINQNALSWGNLVRTKDMENLIKVMKSANKTLVPGIPAALFSKAYWMTTDFEDNYNEQIKRLAVVLAFAAKSRGSLEFNAKGALIKSTANFEGIEKSNLAALELAKYKFEAVRDAALQLPLRELLQLAIICDARSLMQSRNFRMMRNSKSGEDQMIFKEMKKKMIELMQGIMLAHAIFFNYGDADARDLISIDPQETFEAFSKDYYTSYGIVHTCIRSIKRGVFGGTGGAATRARDLTEDISGLSDPDSARNKFDFNMSEVKTEGLANLFGNLKF